MADEPIVPGLHETVITERIFERIAELGRAYESRTQALRAADAGDRLAGFLAEVVRRVVSALPEDERSTRGLELIRRAIEAVAAEAPGLVDLASDLPRTPPEVLEAVLERNPDGRPRVIEIPLTPLRDTTMLTNARGEPAIGHELRAEIDSADSIDLVMAFIRWSGISPLLDAIERHCARQRPMRVLTTTYTNSTELRALEALRERGCDVRVSYDTSATRLHAKAWVFRRESGFSTAYIGSSNLTWSAQVSGIEWNVRISGVRNPDVVAKMHSVFETYWNSGEFRDLNREEFERNTAQRAPGDARFLSWQIVLRPFQEALLEAIERSRDDGHHRNLLVAATGTGKTVMAAVDYSRLCRELPRARLLFVAHRREILEQSRERFRVALSDPTFGEVWVDGQTPSEFNHVFASIQSLSRRGLEHLAPDHFDVVIVDEFHHAAAPTYAALLDWLRPVELLGLTATPERSDGLDVLTHFDGRIAADLRLWDAIDQHYLSPFAYFAIPDDIDYTAVPWRRGHGYEIDALTDVLTGNDVWVRRVAAETTRHVGDPTMMRALGFCVSVAHAEFMARKFSDLGIPSVALTGQTSGDDRRAFLRKFQAGEINVIFAVDVLNEGVDLPLVDTLLFLRPTDSATLFLQQLGRGLRRAEGKDVCTVLDFVGQHRKEFRFDLRLRAILGGSRRDLERAIEHDFPFLPSGCSFRLEGVARELILANIRAALPSTWKARVTELRSLGDVGLAEYLDATGTDLDDVYANKRSWTALRRDAGLPTLPGGSGEEALLAGVGRLTHVDDQQRFATFELLARAGAGLELGALDETTRRQLRMLLSVVLSERKSMTLEDAVQRIHDHPAVWAEILDVIDVLRRLPQPHRPLPLGLPGIPLMTHARYARSEALAAFGVGEGALPPRLQAGVYWCPAERTDLFFVTLDKSAGSFSPNTRYRDYAISPDLFHWESQATTTRHGAVGQRYLSQRNGGTNVVIFVRNSVHDRAFWCLGLADHVSDQGERPIAITWRLRRPMPGDVYSIAAAVA
jgi:superfamily II DNA or RNA helicase